MSIDASELDRLEAEIVTKKEQMRTIWGILHKSSAQMSSNTFDYRLLSRLTELPFGTGPIDVSTTAPEQLNAITHILGFEINYIEAQGKWRRAIKRGLEIFDEIKTNFERQKMLAPEGTELEKDFEERFEKLAVSRAAMEALYMSTFNALRKATGLYEDT